MTTPRIRKGIATLLGIITCLFLFVAPAKAQDRDTLLKHFDEAVSMEYALDADLILDSLQAIATQQHDDLLQFRVNYNRALLLGKYDEEHGYAAILFIDSVMQESQAPYRNLYQYILYRLLEQYGKQNHYTISQRSNILNHAETGNRIADTKRFSDLKISGLDTYGFADLLLLRNQCLFSSIQDADVLVKTPTRDFDFMFQEDISTKAHRATLLDVILQTQIEELSKRHPMPEDSSFILNHYSELAQPDWYHTVILDTGRVASAHHLLYLYQTALKQHSQQDRNTCVCYEIDKAEWLSSFIGNPTESKKERLASLEKIQSYYSDADSLPILYNKALLLFDLANHSLNNNDKTGIQDTLAECYRLFQTVAQHGGFWLSNNASYYLADLDKVVLSVSPTNDFYPQAKIFFPICYKKIDTLYLTIKRVDIEAYVQNSNFRRFSKQYRHLDSTEQAFFYPLQTFRTDTFALKDGSDYITHYTDLFIDSLPAGKYYILFHNQPVLDSNNVQAISEISVSKIRMAQLSTCPSIRYVWALDAIQGTPLKGATVERIGWHGSSRKHINARGYAKIGDGSYVSVQYQTDNYIRDRIDSYYYPHNRYRYPYYYHSRKPRVLIFADRSIYRPGQTLYFKTIHTRHKKSVIKNHDFYVTLNDQHGKSLDTIFLTTNKFGSADSSFTLPSTLKLGKYRICIHYKKSNYESLQFSIEEYRRPTFEVLLKPIEGEYYLGDTVTIEGYVRAYSGAPVVNARVNCFYTLPGETYSLDTTSDYAGRFTFRCPLQSTRPYSAFITPLITATDLNGETHSADKISVLCNTKSLQLTADCPNFFNRDTDSLLTGNLSIKNGAGSTIEKSYTIEIHRVTVPDKTYKQFNHKVPDRPLYTQEEYRRYFPAYTDDYKLYSTFAEYWPVEESFFNTDCNAPEWNLDPRQWEDGYYKIIFKVVSQSGDTLQTSRFVTVYSDRKFQSKDAICVLAPEYYDYKSTAKFTICSSLDNTNIQYGIFFGKKLIAFRHFNTKEGQVHQDSIRLNRNQHVSILAFTACQGKLFHNEVRSFCFKTNKFQLKKNKKYKDSKLHLELAHYTDQMNPGQKEQWKLIVSQKDSTKKANAEILAWMYDVSLDKLYAKEQSFNPLRLGNYMRTGPRFSMKLLPSFSLVRSNPEHIFISKLNEAPFLLLQKKEPTFIQDFSHLYFTGRSNPLSQGGTSVIKGRVIDHTGEPLSYTQIFLKQGDKTVNFAMADDKGEYCLFGVSAGQYDIVADAQMTCKKSQRKTDIIVQEGRVLFIDFSIDCSSELAEVVIAYEPPVFDADNTSSSPRLSAEGLRTSAGRSDSSAWGDQKGANSIDGDITSVRGNKADSQVIVDGVRVRDGNTNFQYSDEESNLASPSAAISQLLGKVQPRTNFSELAFFYPTLRTNEKGETVFEFDAPEQLTRWRFLAFAHTPKCYWDTLSQEVVTQRPLMVVPNQPRFFREGDSLLFQVKITNISHEALIGKVRLTWTNPENEQPVTFLLEDEEQDFTCDSNQSVVATWRVKVPSDLAMVKYKVVAAGQTSTQAANNITYSDGEERVIPILPNSIKVLESTPFYVRRDSTLRVKPNYTASDHAQDENWQVAVNANTQWSIYQSLPYLIEYRHNCNEQIFSKLFAESLAQTMISANPSIAQALKQAQQDTRPQSPLSQNEELKGILLEETPWLNAAASETSYLQKMATMFNGNTLTKEIDRLTRLLEQNQKSDGTWGWFSGFHSDRFITQHILAGMAHLDKIGANSFHNRIQDNALEAIHSIAKQEYRTFQDDTSKNKHFYFGNIHAHYLYTASFYPLPESEHIIFFIDSARRAYPRFGLYTQAELATAFHRIGMLADAQKLAKALQQKAHRKNGMVYWTEQAYDYSNRNWYFSWHELPIETHAMLMEAMIEILPDNTEKLRKEKQEMVVGMRQWLLNQREGRHWNTTKATTEAVYAIIRANQYLDSVAGTTHKNSTRTDIVITAGDQTFTHPDTLMSATYELQHTPAQVTVSNFTKDDINGSIRHWATLPLSDLSKATSAGLSIEKKLYREVNGGASLQLITDSSTIKVGEKIVVRMVIQSNKTIEYVHLKDMRAAAFEPEDVLSRYRWADGLHFYQSPSDASMNFFFDKIEKGTYVIEYALRASQVGTFNNGVATIQCLYAPDFTAHSSCQEVTIE